MSEKIFFYHKNCKDGVGAAYAAYEKYGDEAKYVPIAYGQEDKALRAATPGSEVFFVDFSLKRDKMIDLAGKVKSIEVVDHHESAKKELVDLPENVKVTFDMDKSGAVLTWERFHDTPVPEILLYIEDRDIWNWNLPKSKEFSEGLVFYVKDNDIAGFREFAKKEKATVSKFKKMGEILLAPKNNRIATVIESLQKQKEHISRMNQKEREPKKKKKFTYNIGGKEFILVNFTEKTEVSDLGNQIADTFNIPAAIYSINGENVSVSLRSNEAAGPINNIAASFGGGGHPMASGMGIKLEELIDLIKDKKIIPINKQIEEINIKSSMNDEAFNPAFAALKK